MLDGGGPRLQVGVLQVFAEAAKLGSRPAAAREWAWLARRAASTLLAGRPEVDDNGVAWCCDGYSFRTKPRVAPSGAAVRSCAVCGAELSRERAWNGTKTCEGCARRKPRRVSAAGT